MVLTARAPISQSTDLGVEAAARALVACRVHGIRTLAELFDALKRLKLLVIDEAQYA